MQYKSSVGKLIIAFAISLLMLSSVALAGVPSKLPLQCYSSKQVTTYNSANGSRWGYISANVDLIQITQISGEWAYGSYPTSRGRISRWFRLSDIVPNLSFGNYDTGMYRASTAYRTEGGSSTIGSVYANDTVTVVYRGNNRSQVIYPVSGGYKLGWVNNNDIKPLSQPTPSSPNLYNLTAAYPMDGVYTLTPGCATNMNLSIYNDGTANKAQAVIYNAGYRNSSKWKIQRIGNSEWYYIIDVNSGKSLDNEAGRGANGNMISLWPEQGVCQRWRFWQVRNGVYVIQAYTNDQFVLDVAGADTRANTIVQLWPYNASPAQQWMLTKTQQSVIRPATNNTFQQYNKTAQRQTKAYATSSLDSVYGNEWVDKGDVVTVLEETSNAYKVRYPVRNGYKERWVNKNIFTVESVSSNTNNNINWDSKVGQQLANTNGEKYKSGINPFKKSYREDNGKYHETNCTWYAWGRFAEVNGQLLPCRSDGKTWYNSAKAKGWPVGTSIRANSVAVTGRKNSQGKVKNHVLFIEAVVNNYVYYTDANAGKDFILQKNTISDFENSWGIVGYIYKK